MDQRARVRSVLFNIGAISLRSWQHMARPLLQCLNLPSRRRSAALKSDLRWRWRRPSPQTFFIVGEAMKLDGSGEVMYRCYLEMLHPLYQLDPCHFQ